MCWSFKGFHKNKIKKKKKYALLPPLCLYAGQEEIYFIVNGKQVINRKELKGQLQMNSVDVYAILR